MNRKQRTFAYIGTGVLAGLLIAGALFYTVSRTEFGMERVRRYAVSWLAERVNGTVRIGRVSGNGLFGGVTLHDFTIVDSIGRPFLNTDSATLAYNWRTLLAGEIVVEHSTLYNPHIVFEQLPGDTIWNFQHVFPDRSKPGEPPRARRLILLRDMRIRNGVAIVRRPLETAQDVKQSEAQRVVIEKVPGGLAQVMRFDSVNSVLSRVLWESPTEDGKLIDIRSLSGRGFVWRDPMHVTDARGTVTLRDSIVAFDIPDARFPASRGSLVGRVIMERGQNFYDVRVDSRQFVFRDLQWLYAKLPESGGGSGILRIQSQRPKGTLWLATDARLSAPGTRVAGSFGVVTGADSLYFTNVDLRASPLNLELIQSMLPQKLPVKGLLVGTVEVKGGLSSLETRGDVHLSDAGATSSMKWRGTFDVKHGLGAQDFKADVQTLDLGLLNALRPSLNLKGQVSGHVEASGNVNSNVNFTADLQHYLSGYTSSFNGTGTYTGGVAPTLDVSLNALPLSLQELAASYPAFARLRGEARGPVRLYGALDDLAFDADLETVGGRAKLNGKLTRSGELPRYAGTATLYSFQLDRLIDALPETQVDGKVAFDITGSGLQNARGTISTQLQRGTVQNVDFRDAHAALALESATLRVDTLRARTVLGELNANGTFGLDSAHTGKLAFTLRTDSIAPLDRDETRVAETAGRVRGSGFVNGSIASFDLNANVDIENLRYAALSSDRLRATVTGGALATKAGQLKFEAHADTLTIYGIKADSGALTVGYGDGRGNAAFAAGSRDGNEYIARSDFELKERGLLFTVNDLRLGKTSTPWRLARGATVMTDDHGLTIDSLEVRQGDSGRVHAGGHIAWHDASHAPEPGLRSDFRLDFNGVPFTEFALVTAGSSNVRGSMDGHVRVTGDATAPILDGDVTINNLGFRDAALDQLSSSFTYTGRRINARIDAEKGGRRVLFADGVIPIDLAFVPVKNRKLNEPLRFSIQTDSLPATFLTAWVDGFSDVRGRLDGNLALGGSTTKPTLAGSLALNDGAASWDVTGVRYRDVDGTIRVEGERLTRVDATIKANGGSGHVTGTIDFKRLSDPSFDLLFNAQDFLASRRRDVEFTGSGNVQLQGRFRQPVVTGVINVDQGTMYLDELYRRYQIVELDNPLLYDVVDTSLVSLRTILPRTQNPFVKNLVVRALRVNVGHEAWLRSRDLNVEVSGDLTVAFILPDTIITGPRTAEELVLNGTLRAVRGTYQMSGPGIARQFTIRDGTIEFPGTPGVDPNLAFNAVYRARSQQRDPIDIVAVVGGSLRTPRVRLTSDQEPPISESDLASYLFFGVPTYELSATQNAAVTQVTTGALASSVSSYLASGLQTFAQSFGLFDYVSLSAAETTPGLTTERGLGLLFARTQLEVGRYLSPNIYIAVSQRLASTGYQRPGVRVEWTFQPSLTGEFFVEDRFARSPDFGIQNAVNPKRVWGFFVYREWGY